MSGYFGLALARNFHTFVPQGSRYRERSCTSALYSISPSNLAVALEDRGFESLWASEHSHLPIPGDPGDEGPREVQAVVMDPFPDTYGSSDEHQDPEAGYRYLSRQSM